MSDFTISTTTNRPYPETLEAARTALADVGFGILTEIDLKATLKEKLGVDVEPQVILGACRPALAYEAIQVEPSIAAVLPCNVVVRALTSETTVVEAFDPQAMVRLAGSTVLDRVAVDARERLQAALAALAGQGTSERSR